MPLLSRLYLVCFLPLFIMTGCGVERKASSDVQSINPIVASPILSRPIAMRPLPPFEIPKPVEKIHVGVRKHIYPPIHKFPILNIDAPVVHPLLNMYQDDQRYAGLFSSTGASEICGPAAMANVLIYLKFNHAPTFPKILKNSTSGSTTNGDYVNVLFSKCNTSKDTGTLVGDMRNCAKEALQEGSYNTTNTFIRGIHSDIAGQRFAPGPGDLRVMSATAWKNGDDVSRSDRGVVALFGWYSVNWNQLTSAWEYTRVGGHYVTLAGYDRKQQNVFYVSNPLVDYNAPGFGNIRYSKIILTAIPAAANVHTPGGFTNMWQSQDLVGGNLAVLEDLVVTLPWH